MNVLEKSILLSIIKSKACYIGASCCRTFTDSDKEVAFGGIRCITCPLYYESCRPRQKRINSSTGKKIKTYDVVNDAVCYYEKLVITEEGRDPLFMEKAYDMFVREWGEDALFEELL